MRTTSKIIVILLVILLLAGCSADQTLGSANTQVINRDNGMLVKLSATPLSADTAYQLTNTNIPIETSYFSHNYKMLAQTYVNNATENDEFATYYRASDRIEAYPILGTYFEPTDSVVYLFYQNECPFAIAMIPFDSVGNAIDVPICKDMSSLPDYVEALSIEDCYMALTCCMRDNPDFEILGIIMDTQGYPAIYPVGRQKDDPIIKYMAGEACNFALVDPFETMEAGYSAFKNHLMERKDILAEITIYPWNNTPFYELGYIREFKESILTNQQMGEYSYIEDYDSLVAIPLLSPDLTENVYILHLLYYHNQLIAEVVIERRTDGTNTSYAAVWENIAERASDGQYLPIETSQYVSVLNNGSLLKSSLVCQGVIYDNQQLLPVGIEEGKLVAFYSSTDAIAEYKVK